jgi:hypothetical protein
MTGTTKLLLAAGALFLLGRHQSAALPLSPAYGTGFIGPYAPDLYEAMQSGPPDINLGGPQQSELIYLATLGSGGSVPILQM